MSIVGQQSNAASLAETSRLGESQTGTIDSTRGISQVGVPECHEHREHHEVDRLPVLNGRSDDFAAFVNLMREAHEEVPMRLTRFCRDDMPFPPAVVAA